MSIVAPTIAAAQEQDPAETPLIPVTSYEAAPSRQSVTREDIARQIESASAKRNLGIAGIALGAAAAVVGWVSFVKEVDDEDDRDWNGRYDPAYRDGDEDEDFTTFYAGLAVGVAFITVGTLAVVDGTRDIRRLNQQRVRLGYNAKADAMTVGLNFDF